ncbi:MAG: 23S rRNA (adenine2503-C2)-methyltransferase [Elusimicrobia bacterium]|nr:MAG: 23S rRNA (adenine2503-C2)-methyltransferase [Elusimicrobiota bacterium]KAF0154953.1 MAG: 23S rRNA (adenine2503-C2)-methyltransferase [Elusimicrobiota bacterium]
MKELDVIDSRRVPGLAGLYLARLPGGDTGPLSGEGERLVEFVDTVEPGVPKTEKWVLMVSTQLGCPVGCAMCDAGAMGFHGDLSAREMLAQVRRVLDDNPDLDPASHPKLKIHFARMGEPSLNPAVLEALELLAAEFPFPGLMPSLSTVAPAAPAAAEFMEKLIAVKDRHYSGGKFQLQFSLHATEAADRRELVPVPVWDLAAIAAYGRRFVKPGDRKITLNFALPEGAALGTGTIREFFDPSLFLVKVTPVNPTWRAGLTGTAYVWNEVPPELASAAAALEGAGFDVILSPSAPEEIEAATSCGQLWAAAMKERASAGHARAAGAPGGASRLPFDRSHCALLVVDMQRFFLDEDSPAYMPGAAAALAKAAELARAFRRAGRPVFFTVHAHEDPEKDGGLMTRKWKKVCLAGTPAAQVSPELDPREGEVFVKNRYSAFTNPALERRLRELGVDSLVVAGVKTDLCVESTVRAAFDLGFSCLVAADAAAAARDGQHRASLAAMARGFAAVGTTGAIIGELAVEKNEVLSGV